eukprot:1190583-Prorocentrum_minimum.AAC.4
MTDCRVTTLCAVTLDVRVMCGSWQAEVGKGGLVIGLEDLRCGSINPINPTRLCIGLAGYATTF